MAFVAPVGTAPAAAEAASALEKFSSSTHMPRRVKGLCQTRLEGCAYQARGAVPRDTLLRGGSESHTSCVGWEGLALGGRWGVPLWVAQT
jgi:hypothetical protein